VTTDRQALVELLDALDRHLRDPRTPESAFLRNSATRARVHLVGTPAEPCSDAVDRASAAAYAAGKAAGAGARPDRRQGVQ
jgi:hypothetical protein